MTAAASVVVIIITNLFNCMFCIGICGVGSGSGANSGYGGSFLAHHLSTSPTTITTSTGYIELWPFW